MCHFRTWPVIYLATFEHMFAQRRVFVCELCGREYEYDFRRGHTRRRCNSCRTNRPGLEGRRARQALKKRMLEYKGGQCQRCGYDRCIAALAFHHVLGNKRFNVAGSHCRSWTALRAELDKCVVLCMNCHVEEHDIAEEARYKAA